MPTTSDAIQWLSHYAGTKGWKDETLVWSCNDWNRFEDVGGDWADIMSETKYAGALNALIMSHGIQCPVGRFLAVRLPGQPTFFGMGLASKARLAEPAAV